MGNPEEYKGNLLDLNVGVDYDMRDILRRLVDMQYDRNDMTSAVATSECVATRSSPPRVRGNVLRIEMFGDTSTASP